MKTSQGQHLVRAAMLGSALAVLQRELPAGANATVRNQLQLIADVASELRELAAMPDVHEPERHPLYISGKVLADEVLNSTTLNGRRRAAARVFLELAKVKPSSADTAKVSA